MEIGGSADQRFLERDVAVLNTLAGRFLVGGEELQIVAGRDEVLQRIGQGWLEEPSLLLRLAAIANGLDECLDERFARAPRQLSGCLARAPWSVTPDEAKTLALATLVRLEELEYESFIPDFRETPMVLRDALTSGEDLSAIASMVRWESLERRQVWTPDLLLQRWAGNVSWFARRAADGFDEADDFEDWAEYLNVLDARRELQRFVAAPSWAGQAQWREHIEPVDQAFRDFTERQEVPLALSPDAKPGAWWDYRLPVGVPDSRPWAIWPIKPTRYVAGGHDGGLRTISHVWELAQRPCGLRAMTDQELARWADLCSRNAAAITARDPNTTGWWTDQHHLVGKEQQRRAAENEQGGD